MNFDADECLVTAMFDKGNRNDTMEAIDNIIPFLKGDADMIGLVCNTIRKLFCMSDEGYVMYKELNPDLVTLDITMPKMDGIEALMLIKKYNENAEAVMITAAGQKEKMIQAVKYGASEFITKPYESDEVERIIAQILD